MDSVEIFLVISNMVGGLALFLFGMNIMSKSLSALTGGLLDKLLGVVTKNRFTAFIFGTCLTAVVQSSSAISVLSVGLVNSGIIKLRQALGLLIGGGLGSTATAWLLSLNALDGKSLLMTIIKPSSFTPFLAIVGVAITMFAKQRKKQTIGFALLGFSVMMIGMNLMSQGVAPLKELPALQTALSHVTNPLVGFLVACAITMLVQSSDATVGMIQALALSMGITYGMAIPLICGAQVGTCITAMISSIGTSNNGKRTALMNLYYALLRVIPFMILFYTLNSLFKFSFLQGDVGGVGIPICHSMINIFGALIWIPFGDLIIYLANKTIPFSEEEREARKNILTMLDKNLLSNSPTALVQTDLAIRTMASAVGDAMHMLLQIDMENRKELELLLDRIKQYNDQITDYIAKLSVNLMNTKESAQIMLLTNSNTAFGEIGDLCSTIWDYLIQFTEMNDTSQLWDIDRTELQLLGNSISEVLDLTVIGYETKDMYLSETIRLYREEVMRMSELMKMRHYKRTHGESGRMSSTTIFVDLCYTQERMIDYCDIVADSLIKYNRAVGKDSTLPSPETSMTARRQGVHELFKDKYEMLGISEDEADPRS